MKRDRLSKNSAPKSALNLPKDPAAKIVKQISDLEVALATLAIKIAELETSEPSALRDRQLEALRRRRAGFELGLARRRAKL